MKLILAMGLLLSSTAFADQIKDYQYFCEIQTSLQVPLTRLKKSVQEWFMITTGI